MDFKQSVPDYLVDKKNTIIQIAFTTLFAFVFINIYEPFGAENWYQVTKWQFIYFSAAVVLTGMITVIISRIILFQLKKSHEIIIGFYIWLIIAEVISMAGFYTAFEIIVLKDDRNYLDILFNAAQNTTLILLIPYILSMLFFAWSDIKARFDSMVKRQRVDSKEIMIPFSDENGKLRITLQCKNILYLESSDNYILIYYIDSDKVKSYIIRTTMRQLEQDMKDFPIERCHRSFAINMLNVKRVVRGKKYYEIYLNAPKEIIIPISRSYENKLLNRLKTCDMIY